MILSNVRLLLFIKVFPLVDTILFQVAVQLAKLGHIEESRFCKAMHDWLCANDQRGITGQILINISS